jgi:hypothetical protein
MKKGTICVNGLSIRKISPILSVKVGANGLEPSTSASRTLRATKLRYAPLVTPLYAKSPNLQGSRRACVKQCIFRLTKRLLSAIL